MNDSLDSSQNQREKDSKEPRNNKIKQTTDILDDGIFTMKISEDMSLRNTLRTGLVEAQGRDTEKIPMYVSWPHWLDDGIVCLYAKDFHTVLRDTIHTTASSVCENLDKEIEYYEQKTISPSMETNDTAHDSIEQLSSINNHEPDIPPQTKSATAHNHTDIPEKHRTGGKQQINSYFKNLRSS